jgi:hypothetical protein
MGRRFNLTNIFGIALTWLITGANQAHATEVVRLNFEGGTYMSPPAEHAESSAELTSELVARLGQSSITIPALRAPSGISAAVIIAAVEAELASHWRKYDLKFVRDRPIDDRYTEVVIGGNAFDLGLDRAFGWSPTDCENANPRNVAFVFAETIEAEHGTLDIAYLAALISQELAHTLGLDHVEGPAELLMRPLPARSGALQFSTACHPVVAGPAGGPMVNSCSIHPGCTPGEQNDHEALVAILGAGPDDSTTTNPTKT